MTCRYLTRRIRDRRDFSFNEADKRFARMAGVVVNGTSFLRTRRNQTRGISISSHLSNPEIVSETFIRPIRRIPENSIWIIRRDPKTCERNELRLVNRPGDFSARAAADFDQSFIAFRFIARLARRPPLDGFHTLGTPTWLASVISTYR